MTCFPRTTSLPAGAGGGEGEEKGSGLKKKKKLNSAERPIKLLKRCVRELPEPKQQNQEDIHITAAHSERLLALIEYVSIQPVSLPRLN